MRKLTILALLTALSAFAADFTGTWTGTMKLKRPDGVVVQDGTAFLKLKQTGDAVTGEAGSGDGDALEIQNGKSQGDQLSFQARENADSPLLDVKLTLKGEELVGSVNIEIEGQKMVADLKFKRQ